MGAIMINQKRVLDMFLDLVRIDSECGHEEALAADVGRRLTHIGIGSTVDDVGNVTARVEGRSADSPAVLFCAHLDTVKPGLVHYDFGDCLRSCCNPAGEEADDLANVYFDTDLCRAIVKGYLTFARTFLTEADRYYLYDAIRLLAFELGLGFFAGFIAGDRYFKVRYEGQNLKRARVQFRLCESVETREPSIRKILEEER
jgi:hypothetical protein